jgi:shikimate kinase
MAAVVRKGPKLLKPVALIGFMGAGKSTVGRLLAEELSARFVDLDENIAEATGKSLPVLFREGEARFRAIEMRALRDLMRQPPGVWALGGGAPCSQEARAALAEARVLVVWLQVDATVAARRVAAHGQAARPAWPAGPRAAADLLAARTPAYQAAAQWWVDGGPPAVEVARSLVRRLKDEGYVEG